MDVAERMLVNTAEESEGEERGGKREIERWYVCG